MASSAGARGLDTSNTVVLDACPLRLAALSCANSRALNVPPTVSGKLACASAFGSAGSRLSVNKRSLEIATGVTSPCVMITRTPSLVMPHICRANAPGRRMQPCDARPGDALHEIHGRVAVDVGVVPAILLDDAEHACRRRMARHPGGDARIRDGLTVGIKREPLLIERDDDAEQTLRLGGHVVRVRLRLCRLLARRHDQTVRLYHRPSRLGLRRRRRYIER